MEKSITIRELSKLTTELKFMEKMVEYMPDTAVTITHENNIGELDISDDLEDLKEILNDTLESIAEKMDEIYKNAVEEREDYPEDSCGQRELWLDDVEFCADVIRSKIRQR